jgi:predicted metal-binding membrane protein
VAVFLLGVSLAGIEMESPVLARIVPVAAGVVVLIAGTLQFTAWKTHHLACWHEILGHDYTLPPNAGTAWRHGLRLGFRCSYGCADFTAVLLAIGIMDLKAMAAVTVAISAERLAPASERVARVTGAVVVGTGLLLIARAAGLG